MWSIIAFISGVFVGAFGLVAYAVVYDHSPHRAPRADLPPSTVRQLRRARRGARADLSRLERPGVPLARRTFEHEEIP
jgi:hypothetical protein